jgi:hypothetical protein
MKIKYCVPIIILAFLFLISCGGVSQPKEYTHIRAGFKITAPTGWNKILEDNEMYEFRSGDLKLVEVGGFDLGVGPDDIYSLSSSEFMDLLGESTLDGLDGYCEEAKITNYMIKEQEESMWSGEPAFHVQASGYSSEALASMTVDIFTIVDKDSGRMYMFASQIEEGSYLKAKKDLDLMITSFKLIR